MYRGIRCFWCLQEFDIPKKDKKIGESHIDFWANWLSNNHKCLKREKGIEKLKKIMIINAGKVEL